MSNAKGVGGWQTLVADAFHKKLSPITTLTRFPKGMLSPGLCRPWSQLVWVDHGLANLGGGLNHLPDLENLCGNDTGGIREQSS